MKLDVEENLLNDLRYTLVPKDDGFVVGVFIPRAHLADTSNVAKLAQAERRSLDQHVGAILNEGYPIAEAAQILVIESGLNRIALAVEIMNSVWIDWIPWAFDGSADPEDDASYEKEVQDWIKREDEAGDGIDAEVARLMRASAEAALRGDAAACRQHHADVVHHFPVRAEDGIDSWDRACVLQDEIPEHARIPRQKP